MTPYEWRLHIPTKQKLLHTTTDNLLPGEELVGSTHTVLDKILFGGGVHYLVQVTWKNLNGYLFSYVCTRFESGVVRTLEPGTLNAGGTWWFGDTQRYGMCCIGIS